MQNFMSNTRFLLLWSLGSIASLFASVIMGFLIFMGVGMVVTAIWGEGIAALPSATVLLIAALWFGSAGASIGLIYGNIQKTILKMHTREPWHGWVISSAIGGLLSILAIVLVLAFQGIGYYIMLIIPSLDTLMWWAFQALVIFYGCLGMCQAFALNQYVTGAWVWMLANIVAAIVFYSLLAFGALSFAATPLIAIILGFAISAAPGIVTGFALIWLVNSNWRQDY